MYEKNYKNLHTHFHTTNNWQKYNKSFFSTKNQMKNVTELKFVGYNNKPKKIFSKKYTLKANFNNNKD